MDGAADHLYRLVGRRIAKERRRMNISQTKLGRLTGLTRGSIANIELGRQHAPLHTIWQLGRKMQIDPRALLPDPQELVPEATAATAKEPSARLARVAGASLPKVQQFIKAKKEEVTNEPQTMALPTRGRATSPRTTAQIRSDSTAG